ncbi:MAG TPA: Clp protease N-terminal domain-containing protein [Terriglobales bacterium]|nr:Clp protease N-terminal domain-containing protein [Terriglobales bacterium]
MFHRYTEQARRVIFFGRYEASQTGSPEIDTEHLLLGLLREAPGLITRLLDPEQFDHLGAELRKAAEVRFGGPKVPTSVDLPLAPGGKRVLVYAAEAAESLSHKHIGTEHLLLGLLREKDGLAATILNRYGIDADRVRSSVDEQARPSFLRFIPKSGEQHGAGWMEFVDSSGELIRRVDLNTTPFVPRVGELVVLPAKKGSETYLVLQIAYFFEKASEGAAESGDSLVSILIRLDKFKPPSAHLDTT